ncbi:MAG TPA: RnfABCDGE type electron transport complex subunit D [bacterium]|nr:RnfABCDGE type electron transport complex subunit D [bacterium]HPP29426.1 RnfABCDGE type electron transport complex subunit D [bacterium]
MTEIRCSPHIHSRETTKSIMWSVIIALLPATFGSIYFFGPDALKLIIVCILSCYIGEVVSNLIFRRKLKSFDGSEVVTGLLLAFVLPPSFPLWMAGIGGFLAIFLVKELFGGIGFNIFNPALAARAILTVAYPLEMTQFTAPLSYRVDAITTATPLGILKEGLGETLPSLWQMFIGNRAGCLGETSILLLLIGAIFLLYRRIITWHIPLSYILTVAVITAVVGQNPLFHILAGGLVLGAFFMATDYVTSPITPKGKIIFGIGCGIITSLIRLKGSYPEGVAYSIIFMNMFVPLIDKYTMPKKFGYVKKI